MTFNDTFAGVRAASRQLLEISADGRSRAITALASLVEENIDSILEANARDLSRMDPSNPLYDRLQLTPDRLRAIAADLRHVAALPLPWARRWSTVRSPTASTCGGCACHSAWWA